MMIRPPMTIAASTLVSVLAVCLLLSGSAVAQLAITPPTAAEKDQVKKSTEKAKAKPAPVAKKPEAKPSAPPVAAATPVPSATPDNPNADVVYGAYQRGEYKTAYGLAQPRAQAGDVHAMTMLGELYANGLGVKRDYAKAAEWYKRGSDGGDREAMLALAMMRLGGFGGNTDKQEAVKLLASASKLGEPKAAYNLALLYLDGQTLPQDLKRCAELMRQAADAGNAEAQYALATFYKEGTGVEKNMETAVRLLQAAALADNVDAEVEYAIALFNGTGTPRNQPAAVALLRKAARQGSPIAQNRLAFVLVNGMGTTKDKVEGLKWHLVAKTAGKGDPGLDQELANLSPEDRARAEALAHRWLGDQVDSPARTGQPTNAVAPPAAPFMMPQGGVPGIPSPPPAALKR
jgi:uncharacterized protein